MPEVGGFGVNGNLPFDNDPSEFEPKLGPYSYNDAQLDSELPSLSPIDTERHRLELSQFQVETISIQVIRDRLLATEEPAEKAAVIADAVLNVLPEAVAFAGLRCVILHWFNEPIIEALLEDTNIREKDQIVNVYEQVTSLPFIEHVPWGYTFQDLTREGLLIRLAKAQPELLRSAARLAASAYLDQADDRIQAEALFCFLISGDQQSGDELFNKLTKQADDPQFTANLRDLVTEAPWQLALVCVFQFVEGLSDRQAAEAVRGRIDWKYALSLDLADPGFDFSVLSRISGTSACRVG